MGMDGSTDVAVVHRILSQTTGPICNSLQDFSPYEVKGDQDLWSSLRYIL